MLLLTLLILLAVFIRQYNTAGISISQIEYTALHDLFLSTDGEWWAWRNTSRFGPKWFDITQDPCAPAWQGLTCQCSILDSCYVDRIQLGLYNLSGRMPDSIDSFHNLTVLDMSENNLTGPLPSTIGNLRSLIWLAVTNNSFTGTIPDTMYDIRTMQSLSLDFNQLHGSLSSSINRMSNLQVLYINRNDFAGPIPEELYTLPELNLIDLHNNNFNGSISRALGNLQKLRQIDYSLNRFTGTLPEELGLLTLLQNFHAENNYLNGSIPETIYNCTHLVELVLSDNRLTGTISESVKRLKGIHYLYLSLNNLHGTIPDAIGNLTHIKKLYLNGMNLTGTIPHKLWDMPEMIALQLYTNKLTGSLPSVFGNLSSLQGLEIDNNRLTGTLPACLANLSNLHSVQMYNNRFVGTIPEEWGDIKDLDTLDLSENLLNGSIPETLYKLHRLRTLQLGDCQFTGTISENIKDLPLLHSLDLAGNKLNGTIPYGIGQLALLNSLELSNNQLTGYIPHALYDAHNLTVINVAHNQLWGTLSDRISNLTILTTLIFSDNYISGSLPWNLGHLHLLLTLEGSNNDLTGTIPASVCDFESYFSEFFLEFNWISGTMPECMFKTIEVVELAVYDNLLSGTIPANFSNQYLTDVLLYNNYLSGHLPLFTGKNVEYFEVYNNDFTGTIPPGVYYLGAYTEVALDTNYLTGTVPQTINDCLKANYLSVYNNLLTGTLPKIDKLAALAVFYVDNNMLSGGLDIFDSTTQQFLNSLDVSNNFFSGTLPAELFQIASLGAVASVQNCFTGTIPEAICQAQSLTALALDGLHTAGPCRKNLLFRNYALTYYTPGTIPECIFNMPKLHTLHISGNGLGGSLPPNMTIGPALVDIALSYNQFTGPIPNALQLGAFENFDLSYNNFDGILIDFPYPIPSNGSVYLRVNRLSGRIPPLLRDVETISILNSNMFECQMDRTQLPKHDDQSGTYECGTSSLQHSIYVFVFLLGFAIALAVLLYVFQDRIKDSRQSVATAINTWSFNASLYWNTMTKNLEEYPNINQLNKFISNLRRHMLLLTAVVTAVLMPVYIGLSHDYSVYQYKYAWNVSSVYLSGFTPAVTLFVFYTLWMVFFMLVVYSIGREFHMVDFGTNNRATLVQVVQKRYKHYLGLFAIAIFNFVCVLAVNVAYILLLTVLSPITVTLFQLMLASFKVIWNDLVVRNLTKMLHKWCTKHYALSLAEERVWNNRYISFNAYTLLFNVIVIPCIATAAVSSVCLYNTFVSPLNVESSLNYDTCIEFETAPDIQQFVSPNCTYYGSVTVETTYLPPYIYRYQCASTLVTTYAIVYVYKFIMCAFLQPLFSLFLVRMGEKLDDKSIFHPIVHSFVPQVKHRAPIGKSIRTYIFQPDRFNLRMLMFLSIFVTFGVIFPPLAVMIGLTFLSQTYVFQIILGRFLHKSDERETLLAFLNQDAANVGVMFKNTAYVIGGPAAFFYAFFLFDTYGDEVGGTNALWMSLTMFLIGCACVFVYRVNVNRTRRADEEHLEEVREEDKMEMFGRPSQSIGGANGRISIGAGPGSMHRRESSSAAGSAAEGVEEGEGGAGSRKTVSERRTSAQPRGVAFSEDVVILGRSRGHSSGDSSNNSNSYSDSASNSSSSVVNPVHKV